MSINIVISSDESDVDLVDSRAKHSVENNVDILKETWEGGINLKKNDGAACEYVSDACMYCGKQIKPLF